MDYSAIETRLIRLLENAPSRVIAAYLYGSVARRGAREDSDVDVAVLLRARPPATLEGLELDLEGDLERALKRPVQIVILNTAPSDLSHRVLSDGHLLLDRDRSARIRFEVQARNEYFDLEPLRHLYRGARAAS